MFSGESIEEETDWNKDGSTRIGNWCCCRYFSPE